MKNKLKYSILIGILSFIWLLVEYLFGLHTPENIRIFSTVTLFSYLIPILLIIKALRLEKKQLSGIIRFSESFKAGFLITLFSSVFVVFFQFVYHFVINPNYFQMMIDYSKSMGINNAEDYFNLGSYLLQVFAGNFIIGILVSIITSTIIKKKKLPNENKN